MFIFTFKTFAFKTSIIFLIPSLLSKLIEWNPNYIFLLFPLILIFHLLFRLLFLVLNNFILFFLVTLTAIQKPASKHVHESLQMMVWYKQSIAVVVYAFI